MVILTVVFTMVILYLPSFLLRQLIESTVRTSFSSCSIYYSIIYLYQCGLVDIYFILWVITHYYHYLLFCSSYLRFGK